MITTTLNRIREHRPCKDEWEKLLKHLGKTNADDEPLPFAEIVKSNGIEEALWCCRAEPQYEQEWILFAVWCARQVEHLMTDERSKNALNVAERYANGQATDDELSAARDAAERATWATAEDAAGDAEWYSARAAQRSTEDDAEYAVALDVAQAVAWDSEDKAVGKSARDASAWYSALDAARIEQTKKFLEIVGE